MDCKYTWYNLPNQIKKLIKPFENQLSKEAKNITWWNQPYKLNVLYNELSLIKSSCKKEVDFTWYTLNKKAQLICELINCIKNQTNFDLISTNWGVLQTKDDWENKFLADGASFASITNFSNESNRIKFNVLTDILELDLSSSFITVVNKINVNSILERLTLTDNQIFNFDPTTALPQSLIRLDLATNQIINFNPTIPLNNTLEVIDLGFNQITNFNPSLNLPNALKDLYLRSNQIVVFNPTLPLPVNLVLLDLSSNLIVNFNPSIPLPISILRIDFNSDKFTTLGYTQSEPWASSLPISTLKVINLFNNVDTVIGTNFKTILESKGWTVNG